MKKKIDYQKLSRTLMGIFIILLLVFSTLAYIISSAPESTPDQKIITTNDNRNYLLYEGYQISVQYFPSEVDVYSENINFKNLNGYTIAYELNNNSVDKELNTVKSLRDLQAKLVIMEKNTVMGCVGNCSLNIVDCNTINNAIVIKESDQNTYYKSNNCHVFESTDFNRTVNYILYRTSEVIE